MASTMSASHWAARSEGMPIIAVDFGFQPVPYAGAFRHINRIAEQRFEIITKGVVLHQSDGTVPVEFDRDIHIRPFRFGAARYRAKHADMQDAAPIQFPLMRAKNGKDVVKSSHRTDFLLNSDECTIFGTNLSSGFVGAAG